LTQQYCTNGADVVPVFTRDIHAVVSSYRPISIPNNFSKLFGFIIHDHVLHYVKLNRNQHGFTKSKSTVSKFVTLLDFMIPVVRGQRQVDVVSDALASVKFLLII
jgi:hypothetical protein